MAISTASIDGLPDYTNAQLLKLYRWGLANNAAGQSRSINGSMISFPSVPDMLKAIEYLESTVSSDNTDGSGDIALIRFGERV